MKLFHLLTALLLTIVVAPVGAAMKAARPNSRPALLGQRVVYGIDTLSLDAHTFYLDGSLPDSVADSLPYVFNSFQKAAAHFTSPTTQGRVRLLIAPWVYWIDDPDDPTVRKGTDGMPPLGMTVRCDTLDLQGLTADAREVVLAAQRGQTMGADGNFTLFNFVTHQLRVDHLTMGNYLNVDLDYPLHPNLSRRRVSDNIVQAQLAFQQGQRLKATDCRFVGRLNLCPIIGAREARYERCHFECTDDALNGSATYDDCDFDFYSGKPIWATSGDGAVFNRCTFRVKHHGEQYLTKHSSPVRLIDCRFVLPSDSCYVGWTPDPEPWLRCEQYRVTDQHGRPLFVGEHTPANTVDLWARGMRHVPDGRLHLSHRRAELHTGRSPLTLTAAITGNAEGPLRWHVDARDTTLVHLDTLPDGRCTATSTNHSDSTAQVCITATTPQGYEAACLLTVVPTPAPPPAFASRPRLAIHDGQASVVYALASAKADESRIEWWRVPADGTPPYAVSVSRDGQPATAYRLGTDDVGRPLQARVWAKVRGSIYGSKTTTATVVVDRRQVVSTDTLTTDFHHFPTYTSTGVKDGGWSVGGYKPVDCASWDWQVSDSIDYWHYGTSNNGCVGQGLYQTAQGARLLYTPRHDTKTGDMELELLVDPQKTAGQGFSSARGQYMDIGIKMDTRTLTGYALRIIRTTKHSDAVDFMLMAYHNGEATPLTAPVSSTCYRTNCTLRIALRGNRLTASASTTTPQPESSLAREVYLQARVKSNSHGGILIQHTGTVGEGKTMLHRLTVIAHRSHKGG